MRAWPPREEPSGTPISAHLCCAQCRLRFSPAAAAYIMACPECGERPKPIPRLELAFGFRLIGPEDLPQELPYATARSIALPEPGARRGKEVE
jgi:hypothetical protein